MSRPRNSRPTPSGKLTEAELQAFATYPDVLLLEPLIQQLTFIAPAKFVLNDPEPARNNSIVPPRDASEIDPEIGDVSMWTELDDDQIERLKAIRKTKEFRDRNFQGPDRVETRTCEVLIPGDKTE